MSDIDTIAAICKHLEEDCTFVHTPRVVERDGYDLSKFNKQESDVPGIDTEFVHQLGPGMAGDDFHGTLAYPIGEKLFLLDFDS